jgi:chromosomal replication initiator protein
MRQKDWSVRVPALLAPPPGTDTLGQRLTASLVSRIGATRHALWFAPHTRFVPVGRELAVGVASAHFQDWLEYSFGDAVRAAAAEAFGGPTPVRFVVDPALFGEPEVVPVAKPAAQPNLFNEPPLPVLPKKKPTAVTPARRWRSLDDFVVGPCNRVAHAAALSVVEDPGMGVNPVVFHGPTGTGKTHLLEGIYAGLRRRWPDLRPVFVTGEEFIGRFVQSARFGKQAAFRRQFRDCSALLLDDLHALATAAGSQKEFLYTFDALQADGRQIVVTADCHPRLAEELMPELVDRLLGGAVWGVLPPDDETRLGVLKAKATAGGGPFPDDVLKHLARNLRGNVRELEGAVNGVRHFAKVHARPVTVPLAREALGDLLRHTVRTITAADVDAAVCRVLNLSGGTLQSKARTWAVSHPRMVAVYLCRKHTAATYGEIAKHFGAKQHSTAVAAEKKVRGWLAADATLSLGDRRWKAKDLLDRVERELQR